MLLKANPQRQIPNQRPALTPVSYQVCGTPPLERIPDPPHQHLPISKPPVQASATHSQKDKHRTIPSKPPHHLDSRAFPSTASVAVRRFMNITEPYYRTIYRGRKGYPLYGLAMDSCHYHALSSLSSPPPLPLPQSYWLPNLNRGVSCVARPLSRTTRDEGICDGICPHPSRATPTTATCTTVTPYHIQPTLPPPRDLTTHQNANHNLPPHTTPTHYPSPFPSHPPPPPPKKPQNLTPSPTANHHHQTSLDAPVP